VVAGVAAGAEGGGVRRRVLRRAQRAAPVVRLGRFSYRSGLNELPW
jgi:hypothetical protein